jgi:flavodoxin
MNALVIFESMWGNTEKVARALAAGLETRAAVEVLDVAGEVPSELTGVDLVVVGGPTHAFSMSRESTRKDAVAKGAAAGHAQRGIREWLDGLPEGDVAVATFDTRVGKVKHLPGSAAKKAAKEVRRHHVGRVIDSESFYVDDMEGPLLDGELERAEEWGVALAGSVVPA